MSEKRRTSYELSRAWFDWCFENPDKICPNHTAMYFFIIEHCNRLGWKEKFGLPMEMTKDAIGISNYRTYSKTFNDLVEWGFIEVHEKSKNQWSATIIAIAENAMANTIAHTKALDKAMQKHSQKQVRGTVGIDKQYNNTVNNITIERNNSHEQFLEKLLSNEFLGEKEAIEISCRILIDRPLLENFNANLKISNKNHIHWSEYLKHLRNWINTRPPEKTITKNGSSSKFQQAIESHKEAEKLLGIHEKKN